MLINDRLSTILPTVGAFRRRSMQVKWLSCKGLLLSAQLQGYTRATTFNLAAGNYRAGVLFSGVQTSAVRNTLNG